jgi:hypothetical protein
MPARGQQISPFVSTNPAAPTSGRSAEEPFSPALRDHVSREIWETSGQVDIKPSMSNSPRRNRSWTVILASLLTWIALLSFALSYFYGAGFSSGWLIAGTMVSIAAFCGLLVLKEVLDSLLTSCFYAWCQRILTPQTGHKTHHRPQSVCWESTGNLLDSSFSGSRRAVLGLRSHEISSNRRRKPVKQRQTSGGFVGTPAY